MGDGSGCGGGLYGVEIDGIWDMKVDEQKNG